MNGEVAREKPSPAQEIEDQLRAGGSRCVAGVDEVGLPRWRHLRKHRPELEGQLSLI